MLLFSFLKKKHKEERSIKNEFSTIRTNSKSDTVEFDKLFADSQSSASKDDVLRLFFEKQSQLAPSHLFASGAVFDLCRQNRSCFIQAIESKNAVLLLQHFANLYSHFLNQSKLTNLNQPIANNCKNDTNPATWNLDYFGLPDNETAVILYMPIEDDTLSARMIGIIFSNNGDGYYYCMLNKDGSIPSSVYHNKAMLGIENVGEVAGFGFELMQNFLNLITDNFKQNC